MSSNTREACRLLGVYTAGSFDPWQLAGPAKASCRAHIMSALNGKRTPQSKSGVYAIRAALLVALEIDRGDSCEAETMDRISCAARLCATHGRRDDYRDERREIVDEMMDPVTGRPVW